MGFLQDRYIRSLRHEIAFQPAGGPDVVEANGVFLRRLAQLVVAMEPQGYRLQHAARLHLDGPFARVDLCRRIDGDEGLVQGLASASFSMRYP